MSLLRKIGLAVLVVFALIGVLFTAVFIGMRFGVFNVRGSIAERNQFFFEAAKEEKVVHQLCEGDRERCEWTEAPEWDVVAGGLAKDTEVIARVSRETGVPARIIAAVVVPEQLRFFTAEREVYKSYFEPLKILASLSQFSLGVSGIKQETAEEIERNAASTTSPFYPGAQYARLIAYPSGERGSEALFNRLTDPKDHYYSYLYTALYIQEVTAQWERAGFDIKNNAGVIATLFNLGFDASKPNGAPVVGGALVNVGGKSYAYGELSALFYGSGELTDIFPR